MIEEIRQYIIDRSEAYRRESEDHYVFWNEHIRHVYQETAGLVHFDNIPMLFNSAFNCHGVSLNEVRNWMRNAFEKDYQDLSDRTKELFSEGYHQIMDVVIGGSA